MKLLMQNHKRQAVYVGIIVLCVIGIVWIWVGGRPAVSPISSEAVSQALLGGAVSEGLSSESALLPYGEDFDLRLFEDDRFLRLKSVSQLVVDPEELGRKNPFIPPSLESSGAATSSSSQLVP